MMRWLTEEHGMDQKEAYLHFTANPEVRIHTYQFVGPAFYGSEWSSSRSTCSNEGSSREGWRKDCVLNARCKP